MNCRVHRVTFTLLFPSGVAPGEGSTSNLLRIARNGKGQVILRGTALAGVLRHAWDRAYGSQAGFETDRFFGSAATAERSPLQVPDCVLDPGDEPAAERTFHLRDRHLGRVAEGGLFSLEACPPGTRADVTLWFHDREDEPGLPAEFLKKLLGLLRDGLTFGGSASRGLGLAELDGEPRHRSYDLTDLDELAAWLDDHRAWCLGESLAAGTVLPLSEGNGDALRVTVTLGIPRGQDLLVGNGQGLDYEAEPQRVTAADGKDYWCLPGSTLRGLFRAWVARLIAREGRPVADSHERHLERVRLGIPLRGDAFGTCFEPDDPSAHDRCPVASLFGSFHKAGRIHITSGYAPVSDDDSETQARMHVAIDQITGGAAEHLLFDNAVLTAPVAFKIQMRVETPTEEEARWLAETLRALDLGLLRVGSAKSSGRLSLKGPPEATGPYADVFTAIQPQLEEEEWA